MTGVAVSAGRGGGERYALALGASAACVGVWLVRYVVVEVVVEVVMAAGLGRHRPHRGCHPFTMTAEMARVEAASEGEVNHRCDGRDDADKGSHGQPLCPSSIVPDSAATQARRSQRQLPGFFSVPFSGTGHSPYCPAPQDHSGPPLDRRAIGKSSTAIPLIRGVTRAPGRGGAGCRSAPRSARG